MRGRKKDIMEGSSIFFYGCEIKRSVEKVYPVFSLQQPPESLGPWKHSVSHTALLRKRVVLWDSIGTHVSRHICTCSQISGWFVHEEKIT